MTQDGINELLKKIAIHYPGYARNILADTDTVKTAVVEEWYSRIGYLDFESADRMLAEYLKGDYKTAPSVGYFMNTTPRAKRKNLDIPHRYHVGNAGELLDEAECEYCNPEDLDEIYLYMGDGVIITSKGRVVQGYPTGKPQFKHCCGNCKKYNRGACNGHLQEIESSCINWAIKDYMKGVMNEC